MVSSWFLFFSYQNDARSNEHQNTTDISWLVKAVVSWCWQIFISRISRNPGNLSHLKAYRPIQDRNGTTFHALLPRTPSDQQAIPITVHRSITRGRIHDGSTAYWRRPKGKRIVLCKSALPHDGPVRLEAWTSWRIVTLLWFWRTVYICWLTLWWQHYIFFFFYGSVIWRI